jgi:hypothetical protein
VSGQPKLRRAPQESTATESRARPAEAGRGRGVELTAHRSGWSPQRCRSHVAKGDVRAAADCRLPKQVDPRRCRFVQAPKRPERLDCRHVRVPKGSGLTDEVTEEPVSRRRHRSNGKRDTRRDPMTPLMGFVLLPAKSTQVIVVLVFRASTIHSQGFSPSQRFDPT